MTLDLWNSKMNKIGSKLNDLMPFLTPFGVILGIILGKHVAGLKPAVPYLFALMTFSGALSISPGEFFQTLKKPKFILCYVICSFLAMPLFTMVFSKLCFRSLPDIASGYILVRAIPTAVVGTIWTSIYYGNMAIAISLIILDTLTAPFVTPLLVRLLTNTSAPIDSLGMMKSLVIMVVIPSILGMLCNKLKGGNFRKAIHPTLKPLSKFFLVSVIVLNCSAVAEDLIAQASPRYLFLALFSILLCVSGYGFAFSGAKLFRFNQDDTIALTFAIAMRNMSAALVIAIDYMPHDAALPVILCIVFQQVCGSIVANLIFGKKQKST